MPFLARVWFRLRAVVWREAVNAEFDAELRDHIERETAANEARGLKSVEARKKAMAEFGGVERFKEELRDDRSAQWLHDVVSDLKHGARLLRLNMLYSSVVIGTLALGIGTTSTIFTIVNAVLLRVPSDPEPDRAFRSPSRLATTTAELRASQRMTHFAAQHAARSVEALAANRGASRRIALLGCRLPGGAAGGNQGRAIMPSFLK